MNLRNNASQEGSDSSISEGDFWKAICVLIDNFHALKKFAYLRILNCYEVRSDLDSVAKFSDVNEFFQCINQSEVFVDLSETNISKLLMLDNKYSKLLLVAKVLKKHPVSTKHAVLVLDFLKKSLSFTCIGDERELDFIILFRENLIKTELLSKSSERDQNWCKFVLQSKLTKWAKTAELASDKVKSLSLIDIESYTLLYESLKEKYGKALTKVWTESTDPAKFIYEDVGIATYLILLWKQLKKFRGFVDLGCGNGLLVYILNSEGFPGYGVDIRRRKIWNTYPAHVSLIEEVIVPTDLRRYENVDWIIGNHSDELSCWIPIMAALNSYDTNFFLLPCCAYELNGYKYQRRNCKISLYNDFLQYVKELSINCGFVTKVDRLKIPSTKRIAYLGIERNYNENQFEGEKNRIKSMIKSQIDNKGLKLREKSQAVRNCTQIEKTALERIILKICKYLLLIEQDVDQNNSTWRRGRTVSIRAIAEYFSPDDLKLIKSENGGLKTLLKNSHDIFELNGDKVTLRYPSKRGITTETNRMIFKKRHCFFHNHHPDGCPLTDEDCSFVHNKI